MDFDPANFRIIIVEMIDGPGSSVGYRSVNVWHALQQKGIRVSRSIKQKKLFVNQTSVALKREKHKTNTQAGVYLPRPSKVWHADGYNYKRKPFGFPIHVCTVGSVNGKVFWRYVMRSHNLPDNIAASYLDAVREHGGCPLELYTDLGTENGIMVGTLFLIAVRKIETAVSKLKLP